MRSPAPPRGHRGMHRQETSRPSAKVSTSVYPSPGDRLTTKSCATHMQRLLVKLSPFQTRAHRSARLAYTGSTSQHVPGTACTRPARDDHVLPRCIHHIPRHRSFVRFMIVCSFLARAYRSARLAYTGSTSQHVPGTACTRLARDDHMLLRCIHHILQHRSFVRFMIVCSFLTSACRSARLAYTGSFCWYALGLTYTLFDTKSYTYCVLGSLIYTLLTNIEFCVFYLYSIEDNLIIVILVLFINLMTIKKLVWCVHSSSNNSSSSSSSSLASSPSSLVPSSTSAPSSK